MDEVVCPDCRLYMRDHARYGMCPVVKVTMRQAEDWLLNSCEKCLCYPCQCQKKTQSEGHS